MFISGISKLVVDTTSDKLIAPHGDQTLCFYSYSDSFRVYQDDNGVIVIGPGTSEDDKPEGAYCVVFTASNTIYTVSPFSLPSAKSKMGFYVK